MGNAAMAEQPERLAPFTRHTPRTMLRLIDSITDISGILDRPLSWTMTGGGYGPDQRSRGAIPSQRGDRVTGKSADGAFEASRSARRNRRLHQLNKR
jgi:hypothetical protein